ncbi:MAG TPA: alcohol dehydrogenase catalytic domain-containing protein [Dehalococcoidia bacterium]|nr:alcohol dehydrogenase catalytic domain-containing protein [Dehalococcoidia bacterium]
MRAAVYHGPGDVRLESVPDPEICEPTDVIVRVTRAAICGTDLHLYRGDWSRPAGFVIGHEFTGVVEAVGDQVADYMAGDRVVGPYMTTCLRCLACRQSRFISCERGQFFGFGQLGGGAAEFVHVPLADTTLELLPPELNDDDAIFLSDNFCCGYMSAENGEVRPGDRVAIFGCGPVGLLTLLSARLMGASLVIGVDPVPERLALVERLGGVPVPAGDEAIGAIRSLTNRRGVEVAIETCGAASRPDPEATLRGAIEAVARDGRLSIAGFFADHEPSLPLARLAAKRLTVRFGMCHQKHYLKDHVPLLARGAVRPSQVVSHTIDLADVADAYRLAAERRTVKVLLTP